MDTNANGCCLGSVGSEGEKDERKENGRDESREGETNENRKNAKDETEKSEMIVYRKKRSTNTVDDDARDEEFNGGVGRQDGRRVGCNPFRSLKGKRKIRGTRRLPILSRPLFPGVTQTCSTYCRDREKEKEKEGGRDITCIAKTNIGLREIFPARCRRLYRRRDERDDIENTYLKQHLGKRLVI